MLLDGNLVNPSLGLFLSQAESFVESCESDWHLQNATPAILATLGVLQASFKIIGLCRADLPS